MKIIGDLQDPFAIFISKEFSPPGIHFPTTRSAEFQVGIMQRNSSSNVKLHLHKPHERKIFSTQEFIFIRSGSCLVKIYDSNLILLESILMRANEAILLCKGAHSIDFLEETDLIEVKQGPYISKGYDKEELEI